jgi:putative tricarboxylic transport membrane protein
LNSLRRSLTLAPLAATLIGSISALPRARAQGAARWRPTRNVDYIVPSGPGAALDLSARALKDLVEKQQQLSNPIVVSNRPGGGGTVALNALLARPGDGHALTTYTNALIHQALIGDSSVTWRDMTPVAVLFEEAIVVAVKADSPLTDVQPLIAQLRKDPGSLPIGVATAAGNHIHAAIALPLKAAGIDVSRLTIVPFKSSAESMTALMGGHIAIASASAPNVTLPLSSGRIRVLATASGTRLTGGLAGVPTWRELGVDAAYASVQGVLAPKGLAPEVLAFWESTLRTLSETEEWRSFLARQNWRPLFMGSADMRRFMDTETEVARGLLRGIGMLK